MAHRTNLITIGLILWAIPAFAQTPCQPSLRWYDRWLVIPFAAGAGFRDATSTVLALSRVQTAREANPFYHYTDPRTHPERFAWLIGGVTATGVTSAAMLMASCSKGERWFGRLIALGQGGKGIWAARRNDRIGR